MTVIRSSHYHQYDTYWSFDDPDQGWLRYREDEFLDEAGEVTGARARLTLTGRTREERFGAVLLFALALLAPATHSARFYREYFRPAAEHVVEKDRRRWLRRLSRRRVLRAPRSADEAGAATATSSR